MKVEVDLKLMEMLTTGNFSGTAGQCQRVTDAEEAFKKADMVFAGQVKNLHELGDFALGLRTALESRGGPISFLIVTARR